MEVVFYTDPRVSIGSANMRALNIESHLKKYFRCRCTNQMSNIHNSIVIYIKDNNNLSVELLKQSKNNNNINVVDVIDYIRMLTPDQKEYTSPDFKENGFLPYIDSFIVNNEFMKEEYTKKYNTFTYQIPHHYDPRLDRLPKDKYDYLHFIYNGYTGHTNQNCYFIPEFKNLDHYVYSAGFNPFISNSKYYKCNCHLSIRKENSWEFNVKPAMKVAHAAGSGANIITTYDRSVRDLLPAEYPYILKDCTLEAFVQMVEYVKKTYNTDVWFKGLEMMKKVKDHLRLENVVNIYYRNFITQLQEKHSS